MESQGVPLDGSSPVPRGESLVQESRESPDPGEVPLVREFPDPGGSSLVRGSLSLLSRGVSGSPGVQGIQESSGESFGPGAKAVPRIRREFPSVRESLDPQGKSHQSGSLQKSRRISRILEEVFYPGSPLEVPESLPDPGEVLWFGEVPGSPGRESLSPGVPESRGKSFGPGQRSPLEAPESLRIPGGSPNQSGSPRRGRAPLALDSRIPGREGERKRAEPGLLLARPPLH